MCRLIDILIPVLYQILRLSNILGKVIDLFDICLNQPSSKQCKEILSRNKQPKPSLSRYCIHNHPDHILYPAP
jgi:hypothetical protein